MSLRRFVCTCARAAALALLLIPATAQAAVIVVPAGGDLQAAINSARPGDTIELQAGATYSGNFTLPVHGGTSYITIRTGGTTGLPAAGTRISPSHAKYLAKIKSPNTVSALTTKPGAAYWRLMLLEFGPNYKGMAEIIALGKNTDVQNTLGSVPHHLILDRLYIYGHALDGQKRGIGLNSASTTIVNCYIADIKAIGQDTQAIAGSNGPGPYHIENNFLQASTEVFLLGGDDPKIPGLVPSDLVFRGNVLTRPVSWRNPIVPTPSGLSATAGTGGTLAAGTYSYRVVARRPASTDTATSARSTEVIATVGTSGQVTIRWAAVAGATEYRVYGRTVGNQTMYWRVTGTSFTDTGAAGTAGTPPSTGSTWLVKNIFELKNTRNAQVDYNLMENNWKHGQNGMSVLLTPRNQYGTCTWCVVENVTFEYNVVRHVAGGVNILGMDYINPSEQTKAIRIRHNEFSDVDKSWGGSGFAFQISDGPKDVVIDHNTIVSDSGNGILTVSGPPVYDFVFTNNVARHNSYGIFGAEMGYGNNAIDHYLPGADIRRNVMAGGKASLYPADNLFPTTTDFAAHFVNYAGDDYALRPGTDWANAGTDGQDLGADIVQIRTGFGTAPTEPVRVVTQTLPSTVEFDAYDVTLVVAGGAAPYRWSLVEGSLPAGLTLNPLTGVISGAASAAGDSTFVVQVTDSRGDDATRALALHVDRALPPIAILTSSLPDGTAMVAYTQRLRADGGLGSYLWTVSSGTLPAGMSLTSAGDLTGVPAAAGTWLFTVTARDAQGAVDPASKSLQLKIVPPANVAPSVSVKASAAGTVPVGAPVTLTATTSDADGFVTSVEFFVNGQSAGNDLSAPFTLQWAARDGGPHTISAIATDDDGAEAASAAIVVNTTSEIVLYGSDVKTMVGNFQIVADVTAADGQRLWNANKGTAKMGVSAAPANYAEFTFYAEAGRAYHFWMRGKADGNSWPNDSIYMQFSGAVDAAGTPVYRIGTTAAAWYSLEEDGNVGVSGWGWQDNGFGLNVMGVELYFEKTGLQTLRLQQREDGLSIDQVVLSPAKNLAASPGLSKNDSTILAK